tara:strand:+ start:946 stop:1665 length:720 start_codon:yes stop_codon:yes gene_type:complete
MPSDYPPFILFSPAHLRTVGLIFAIGISVAAWMKNSPPNVQRIFEKYFAWTLIVFESFKPFYRFAWIGEPWQEVLPLYLCNMSIYLLAFIIFTKSYRAYEIVYFWAFAGGVMALATPDVPGSFPHPEYLLYFTNHGLIILGVFFVSLVYGYRPKIESIWHAYRAALVVLVLVFPLNYILGEGANYLYLRDKPQVGSLMDFMPNPPFHIPIVMVLAYLFFWLVYLPYFFRDYFMKRNALT